MPHSREEPATSAASHRSVESRYQEAPTRFRPPLGSRPDRVLTATRGFRARQRSPGVRLRAAGRRWPTTGRCMRPCLPYGAMPPFRRVNAVAGVPPLPPRLPLPPAAGPGRPAHSVARRSGGAAGDRAASPRADRHARSASVSGPCGARGRAGSDARIRSLVALVRPLRSGPAASRGNLWASRRRRLPLSGPTQAIASWPAGRYPSPSRHYSVTESS